MISQKKHILCFTGGGSGGHTSTSMAVIDSLLQQGSADIFYIGSRTGVERKEAAARTIEYYPVFTGKLRRYFSLQNFTDVFRIILGFWQSAAVLLKKKPHLVIATGGFVSVPVCAAAWILRIPCIIHEQTVAFGLANRICALAADKVLLSFEESRKFTGNRVCQVTGNPIRRNLFFGSSQTVYERFDADPTVPLVYITGGAQGSTAINDYIFRNVSELLKNYSIIHQTGDTKVCEKFLNEVQDNHRQYAHRYHCAPYFSSDDLAHIYAAAACVAGRSGAGTVNELMMLKIPALLIPLPHAANDEQRLNAKMLCNRGFARMVEQSSLDGDFFDALKHLTAIKREPVSPDADTALSEILNAVNEILCRK